MMLVYLQMCTLMRHLIGHNPQPVDKHVTLSALLVCSTVLIVWVGVYSMGYRCLLHGLVESFKCL